MSKSNKKSQSLFLQDYADAVYQLEDLQAQKDFIESQLSAVKSIVLDGMEAYNLRSIETESVIIKNNRETVVQRLDIGLLKSRLPEIYHLFTVCGIRKKYLSIQKK